MFHTRKCYYYKIVLHYEFMVNTQCSAEKWSTQCNKGSRESLQFSESWFGTWDVKSEIVRLDAQRATTSRKKARSQWFCPWACRIFIFRTHDQAQYLWGSQDLDWECSSHPWYLRYIFEKLVWLDGYTSN